MLHANIIMYVEGSRLQTDEPIWNLGTVDQFRCPGNPENAHLTNYYYLKKSVDLKSNENEGSYFGNFVPISQIIYEPK